MAFLDILCSNSLNAKSKITKIEHKKNILWSIKNFEKYFMAHQYMPTYMPTYFLYSSLHIAYISFIQVCIYLFKVNMGNTRTMREICSKLTVKTSEWRQWRCFGVLIVNFEQISRIVLGLPLLPLNKRMLAGRSILLCLSLKLWYTLLAPCAIRGNVKLSIA